MSRVARIPVTLPKGAEASVVNGVLLVKGPMGTLNQVVHSQVKVQVKDGLISFEAGDDTREAKALSGTFRALTHNMVTGVTTGFERKLTLVGVGFKAAAKGDSLDLALGYSHPVVHKMPQGVSVTTPTPTEIVIKGSDKQKVGQVAAEVRAYRPPEPYKGKGVRYVDEVVVIKETKKK
jgi:large subunit ribosomal protein L6